jgi:hypothetical protein
MLLDKLLRQCDHVLRLATEQSDGLDVFLNRIFSQCDHLFRRVGNGEEGFGRLVDAFVRRLRGKYDRHKQGKVVDRMKLTLGFRIGSMKTPKDFSNLVRLETACLCHDCPVLLAAKG